MLCDHIRELHVVSAVTLCNGPHRRKERGREIGGVRPKCPSPAGGLGIPRNKNAQPWATSQPYCVASCIVRRSRMPKQCSTSCGRTVSRHLTSWRNAQTSRRKRCCRRPGFCSVTVCLSCAQFAAAPVAAAATATADPCRRVQIHGHPPGVEGACAACAAPSAHRACCCSGACARSHRFGA